LVKSLTVPIKNTTKNSIIFGHVWIGEIGKKDYQNVKKIKKTNNN